MNSLHWFIRIMQNPNNQMEEASTIPTLEGGYASNQMQSVDYPITLATTETPTTQTPSIQPSDTSRTSMVGFVLGGLSGLVLAMILWSLVG